MRYKILLTRYVNKNLQFYPHTATMEIYWKREKLRKEVEVHARSNRITARRMASMKAAVAFPDLRPASQGRAHFLKGKEYAGCFSIDLEDKGNGKRLICVPRGDFKKDGDQFIEETITELTVIAIEDYH